MAYRQYKPNTPGSRHRQVSSFEELTENEPEKSLLRNNPRSAGRNNNGRITVRRRGGGVKRRFRIIDFKRNKEGVRGKVVSIEYDPNRSAYISLISYIDGEKAYIVTPLKLKVGDFVDSGPDAEIKVGNCLPLSHMPTGSVISNVETVIGKGAQLARSAGSSVVLMAKSLKYATVKLPSGEVRLVNIRCRAVLGQVGNILKRNLKIGKAGVNRWRNKRPKVRGAAMNACDHGHGGGEGKAPVGMKSPVTPWGKRTGKRTRNRKKQSSKLILKRRKK
ncbi:MAG: 50S ribosomal protein L2 [Candidatus Margulisbacteria bacterium]|nr:50S ribosomal protein L2 [Candidatus Margulisiibacteriota bacterium]